MAPMRGPYSAGCVQAGLSAAGSEEPAAPQTNEVTTSGSTATVGEHLRRQQNLRSASATSRSGEQRPASAAKGWATGSSRRATRSPRSWAEQLDIISRQPRPPLRRCDERALRSAAHGAATGGIFVIGDSCGPTRGRREHARRSTTLFELISRSDLSFDGWRRARAPGS